MAASPCWVAPQQLAAICTYAPAVFWFVSTAAALLSTQLGRLAALTSYGRALDTDNSKTTFTVPKSYFLHFYVLGLMVNGLNVVVHWYVDGVAQSFWSGGCAEALLQCPPHLASALLFQVHLARRAYECVFVHKFSPQARMTWMVYVGGLAHYFMVPFSFHPATTSGVRPVAMALFLASNAVQHVAHVHLASLRPPGTPPGVYPKPTSWLFRRVACPHYTAEVCLYVALTAVPSGGPPAVSMLCLSAWVATNLTITARRTLQAARKRSTGPAADAKQAAIIPFVL